MDWGWKGEGTIPSSSDRLKVDFWRSKIFPMGRCDPGDQILLKIQSTWNRFKSNGIVGLIVTIPMQLVWVQTDVGWERCHVLFKMSNRKKKGMLTVQSVRMLMWHVHTTRGRAELAGLYNTWHSLVGRCGWMILRDMAVFDSLYGATWPRHGLPCGTPFFGLVVQNFI